MLAENSWLKLWVWEGEDVSDTVPAKLGVAACVPVAVLVGEEVNDEVDLLLGVNVAERLCVCVSDGVPDGEAVAPWVTL